MNSEMTRPVQSTTFSISIHALVLVFAWSFYLLQPHELGFENGSKKIEFDLVAMNPATPVAARATIPMKRAAPVHTLKNSENEFSPEESSAVVETRQASAPAIGRPSHETMTAAKPDDPKNPTPTYPEYARLHHQEGVVSLLVEVLSDGSVKSLALDKSSGFPLLDDAAIDTVKRWQFQPARIDGRNVDAKVYIPVRFKISAS